MVRRSTAVIWAAATLGVAMALAACADLLGIDDGVPRVDDASLPDVQAEAAVVEAGREAEAEAAPPPYSPLACGTETCNAVTQGCCSHGKGQDAAAYTYACVDHDGGSCDGGLLYSCDRPDNCDAKGLDGDVCCAFAPGSGVASDVECVAPSACHDGDGGYGTLVCNPGDDELCPPDSGLHCLPSVLTVVGYPICK